MKNIIIIVISLFIFSSINAQNKKGIIYDYKKNQFSVSAGTKGNFELGYFKRFTKNFSIGLSFSRAVSSKVTYTSGGGSGLYLDLYDF